MKRVILMSAVVFAGTSLISLAAAAGPISGATKHLEAGQFSAKAVPAKAQIAGPDLCRFRPKGCQKKKAGIVMPNCRPKSRYVGDIDRRPKTKKVPPLKRAKGEIIAPCD